MPTSPQIAILPYALTTLARVKAKLAIDTGVTGFDDILISFINGVTEFIEQETNRHFMVTDNVEVHSVRGANQKYLWVKNPPINSLSNLEYAGGMPTIKTWMAYPVTAYESWEDGKSGMIYVYGKIPQGSNRIRITYNGGFLIDFANVGDSTKHNLPFSLSNLADNLVVRAFKRREKNGITSESFDQSNITWRDDLDSIDKQTIANFTILRFI